jgi:hypothetical protein
MLKIYTFIVLVFITTACCTKKDCSGFDYSNELHFKGFSAAELDTVYIERYAKNTNFANKIDSSVETSTPILLNTNEYYIGLRNSYNKAYDYKIKIAGLANSYTITDFVISEKSCNNCATNPNDKFEILNAYKVNGVAVNKGTVEITK